ACCAKYSEDETWYRAAVTSVSGADIKVNFVDYGNGEGTTIENLKCITPELADTKPLSIKCQVVGAKRTDSEKFLDLAMEKELTCEFLSDSEPYQVKLLENDEDITAQFASEGQAETVEILRYPTIDIQKGVKELCYVSFGLGPEDFVIQLSKDTNALDEVMGKLEEQYRALGLNERALTTPVVGQACCAKYSEDETWYRAAVTGVSGADIKVNFIDYGNGETTTIDNLKALTPELTTTKPLCVKCTIVGAKHTDGEKFLDQVMEKELLCEFLCSAEPYQVKLFENNEEISAQFTNETPVDEDVFKDALTESEKSVVQEETVQEEDTPPATQNLSKYADHDIPTVTSQVYISHVESANEFYVQLANVEDELANLADEVQTGAGDVLTTYNVNQPCIAKYSEDDAWYRGKIQAIDGDQVKLLFVDYGNGETVPKSKVHALKEQFLASPPMSYVCKLAGKEHWTEEDSVKFKELTMDQELEVTFLPATDPCEVHLKNDVGDIRAQICIPDSSSSGTEDFQDAQESIEMSPPKAPVSKETTSDDSDFQEFKTYKLRMKEENDVYVAHIVSPSLFWCQLVSGEEAIADLMAQISEHCNGEPTDLLVYVPGQPCLAKFSEDETWYRAQITDVKDAGVVVTFVDYGNSDTIPESSIKAIPDEFLQLEVQGLECALFGVKAAEESWNEKLVDRFSEIVLEKIVSMCVNLVGDTEADPTNSSYVVTLKLDDESVANKLIETGLAVSSTSPSLPLLKAQEKVIGDSIPSKHEDEKNSISPDLSRTDESFADLVANISEESQLQPPADYNILEIKCGVKQEVYVTHTINPSRFWIQMKAHENAITELTTELQDFYTEGGMVLAAVVKNSPCVAKSVEDDQWYRAIAVSVENNIEVQFVDYGNSEVVKPNSIKAISENFLVLPIQGIECTLSKIRSTGESTAWDDTAIEKFIDITADKSLLCEVKSVADDNSCIVTLLDMGMDIASKMIEAEVAIDDATPTYVKKDQSPDFEEEQKEKIVVEKPALTVGSKCIPVYVCSVTNPSDFYCQIETSSAELPPLLDLMHEHYSKLESQQDCLVDPTPGDYCVAQFSKDESWYRAKVQLSAPDSIDLLFIDYGNKEKVQQDKVKELVQEFSVLPQQAFKAQLADVEPLGQEWDEETCTRFEELTYNKDDLKADIIDVKDVNGELHVVLCINEEDKSVSASLAEGGYAKMITPSVEESPKELSIPANNLPSLSDSLDIPPPKSPLAEALSTVVVDRIVTDIITGAKEVISGMKSEEKSSDPLRKLAENYENPQIDIGKRTNLIFEDCSMEGILQCRLADSDLDLNRLMDEIADHCEDNKDEISSIVIGMPTLARSAEDDGWYRAVIIATTDDLYQVKLVDYGKVEELAKSALRPMPFSFLELPIQCISCSLAGINMTSWTETATKLLTVEFGVKKLIGEFENKTETGSYTVYLYSTAEGDSMELESVNHYIVSKCLCEVIPGSKLDIRDVDELKDDDADTSVLEASFQEVCLKKSSSYGSFSTDDLQDDSFQGVVPFFYSTPEVNQGDTLNLLYVTLTDPDNITCQLASSQHQLEALMEDINTKLSQETMAHSVKSLELGLPVCAQYSEDGRWYRAQILAVDKDDTKCDEVDLIYVDYGNRETVPMSRLHRMEAEFMSLPTQALELSLAEVKPVSEAWDEEVISVLEAVCQSEDTNITLEAKVVEVEDDNKIIAHITTSGGMNLRDVLIEKKLGCPLETSSDTESAPSEEGELYEEDKFTEEEPNVQAEPAISNTEVIQKTLTFGQTRQIDQGEDYIVKICHVVDPSQLWCQVADTDSTNKFQQLTDQLQAYCPSAPTIDGSRVTEGDACCARYLDTEQWYRTKVLSVFDSLATLEYVDYGYTESCSSEQLRVISEDLVEEQPFALQCALANIQPVQQDWSDEATRELEALKDRTMLLQSVGLEDGVHKVLLTSQDTGLGVAEALSKKGLVSVTGVVEVSSSDHADAPRKDVEDAVDAKDSKRDTSEEKPADWKSDDQ
ncbi:unnamed protein product, partial [Owenia fusiformis]